VIAMCGYTGPAFAVKGGGHGDQTEKTLWTHPKNPQRVGSGVVVDGKVYILNEPGIAWCLDAATGEKEWEQRLPGGVSWSSMNHVAGRLYVGNTAGTTFVLEPNPKECKVLAENKLGETMRASPAYSSGQIFIRTYQNLYCIEAN
jgi:outer membrane protein assembly factor BamB